MHHVIEHKQQIIQQVMKHLKIILSLFTFLFCSNGNGQKIKSEHTDMLAGITVIETKFPLRLEKINLNNKRDILHQNDKIKNKIAGTVYSYYFNDCAGDSSETYFKIRDTYIGTLRLHDSIHTIFLVLLNHMPDEQVNGKVLFYNNQAKEFLSQLYDFNIHALYDFTKGKLKPSNLKEKYKINSPEIELLYDDKTKTNNYKFTKLYHNGTANAVETTILKIENNKIDTVAIKKKSIGK